MKLIKLLRPYWIVTGLLVMIGTPFLHHFIATILSGDEAMFFSFVFFVVGFIMAFASAISYVETEA